MKKICLIAIAMVCASTASANAAPAYTAPLPALSFSGLYGGVNLGEVSTTSPISGGGASLDGIGVNGFEYGVDAGYGVQFSGPWYAGIELGIGNNTGEEKLSAGPFSGKVTQQFNFIADTRLGYVIGKSLVYAKAGYSLAELKGPGDTLDFNGFRAGGGIETFLTDNIAGRVEGIYTAYDSKTDSLGVKYEPSSVGIIFGLNYYLQ